MKKEIETAKCENKKTKPEVAYTYKKVGKCNQCGMCCLFKDGMKRVDKKHKDELYFNKKIGWTIIKEDKDCFILGKIQGCPYLIFTKEGKLICKLHGTKLQPKICKDYPVHPDHTFYEVFKDWCGYKFKKSKKIEFKNEDVKK